MSKTNERGRSPLARVPASCGSTTCDDFPQCPDCYDKVMADVEADRPRLDAMIYGRDYA